MEFKKKVQLACIIERETASALFCDFGDQRCWIPKSQVDDDSEIWQAGEEGEITISEWIAEQKELI